MTIARLQKAADQLAGANLGYDQGQRWTFFDRQNRKLRPGGECDCSSACGAIAALAGYPVNLSDPFWTGNFVARLVSTGLFKAIKFKNLDQVKPADFLVGDGHVIFARDKKRWWSAEADERGKAAGGKTGNQNGRETRYRAPYLRSKGWHTIVRLISPKVFLAQAIAAHAAGKSAAEPLRLLRIRAPWDGPRWAWMLATWATWEKGMTLDFTPRRPATADHAYVVLGSGLTAAGKITTAFRQRLELAALAARQNPGTTIWLTGGAPKAGITEAAAGRQWLINAGIDSARILTEDKSSSTVGNARNTVPLLARYGVQSYTLISHASHLRRAAILFLAARVQIETANNRKLPLELDGLLAVDDYSPKPIKPARPIDPTSRNTIAGEVRTLLGL